MSSTQCVNDSLVTILAFVYVPLNLATSIFGMNVQQLNQNGQNIWVFFVTAFVALLVTGGSWVVSNWIYKVMSWYKKLVARSAANDNKDEKRIYDLPHRVAMLIWLVHNGHTDWMFMTGAWLAILINSKVKSRDVAITEKECLGKYAACDYVWAVSSSNPRHLDSVQWSTISE